MLKPPAPRQPQPNTAANLLQKPMGNESGARQPQPNLATNPTTNLLQQPQPPTAANLSQTPNATTANPLQTPMSDESGAEQPQPNLAATAANLLQQSPVATTTNLLQTPMSDEGGAMQLQPNGAANLLQTPMSDESGAEQPQLNTTTTNLLQTPPATPNLLQTSMSDESGAMQLQPNGAANLLQTPMSDESGAEQLQPNATTNLLQTPIGDESGAMQLQPNGAANLLQTPPTTTNLLQTPMSDESGVRQPQPNGAANLLQTPPTTTTDLLQTPMSDEGGAKQPQPPTAAADLLQKPPATTANLLQKPMGNESGVRQPQPNLAANATTNLLQTPNAATNLLQTPIGDESGVRQPQPPTTTDLLQKPPTTTDLLQKPPTATTNLLQTPMSDESGVRQPQPPTTATVLAMPRAALTEFISAQGCKPAQALVLMRYMHKLGVLDAARMPRLSTKLRSLLAPIVVPASLAHPETAADGTCKWTVRLADNNAVETVLIPSPRRLSLCVSSQAGCPLGCSFCATGQQGLQRSLSAAEIIAQLWLVQHRYLPAEQAISNVVFMGMGEPMLNLEEVLRAVALMIDDHAYALAKSRVTISTAGHADGIRRLAASGLDVNLAVSIHAANDELRAQLMPINRKYSLAEVMDACRMYQAAGSRRDKIIIQYTLIEGVNDSVDCARQLADLLATAAVPAKINLLPFNPIPHSPYRRSSAQRMQDFYQALSQCRMMTTFRRTRGATINAACGQLANDRAASL